MFRVLPLAGLLLLCIMFAGAERIFELKGNVMVPVRYMADWLGATLTADAKTNVTTLVWNGKTVVVKLDNPTATVAGKPVKLAVAPCEGKGVLYVPLRLFVSLGLRLPENDQELLWNGQAEIVNEQTGQKLLLPILDEDAFTTALHLDALNGLTTLAAVHIKRGVSVNGTDSNGRTPLVIAAGAGQLEMVKYLIDNGASLKPSDDFNANPLEEALRAKQIPIARFLLDKGVPGDTETLALAAECGAKEIVEYLIGKGVNVNPDDDTPFNTPLINAAEAGKLDIVALLLNKGAKIDTATTFGETALFAASKEGYEAVVNLLLEKGAKADKVVEDWECSYSRGGSQNSINYNIKGCAPIHIAAIEGHAEVVEALLKHGVSVDGLNGNDMTPLHLAAFCDERDAPDAIEALLKQKANVNAKTGSFTLEMTGQGMKTIKVKELTPLHLALIAGEGAKKKVQLLLTAGADIKAVTSTGLTPLHLAMFLDDDRDRVVPLLLDKGADVNAKSNDGLTPLKLAKILQATEIVTLLKEKGAKE